MYKPYHLIGLELDISILSAALRGEPTGQPHSPRRRGVGGETRPARDEMLDGEGGYGVGELMPAAAAWRRRAADRSGAPSEAEEDIAHGAVVRWSDVEIDADR